MGEGLLQYYKTKLKKEYKIAFFSTFLITLLIHLYKFTNVLHNHDSVSNFYSDQNVLASGRWALSMACGISSYYDLPWIIGLLSCVFLALTVVVIVALFRIKNPVLIGLTGALLAAAPATTETFFFLYTADGYMIAMLLAALAVYFSRVEENRLSRWVLSGICICVSCAIYQAYVSFALLLAVCYFIDDLLQDKHNKKACFTWVLRQAILYALSLAVYYIVWKLCMRISGITANDYQGISEVGKINAGLLKNGLISAVKTTILFFLQWDVLERGFTLYSVLNIIFVIAMAMGLLTAVLKSKIFKRKWAAVLLVLCLVAIVPFACIWHFTADSIIYRPMMLQSLTLLFVLTALLYERWTKPAAQNTIAAFLLIVVFNNALMANISYSYMHLCYERTYAEGLEMMAEIHDLQDVYDFDKIAVLGVRPGLQYRHFNPETGKMLNTGKLRIFTDLLEKSLLFDSNHTLPFLNITFGLSLQSLSLEEREQLHKTEEVRAMGCWPAGNSIAVIDDILVIKLAEAE